MLNKANRQPTSETAHQNARLGVAASSAGRATKRWLYAAYQNAAFLPGSVDIRLGVRPAAATWSAFGPLKMTEPM
jgi:hypothetical protein